MMLFFPAWVIQLCGIAFLISSVPTEPNWVVYAFRVPLCIGLFGDICQFVGYWRLGPLLLETRALKKTFHFFMIISFISQLLGFLCPDHVVPTGSALLYTFVVAVRTIASNLALALMPHKRPPQPFESFRSLYLQALVSTIKIMDACAAFHATYSAVCNLSNGPLPSNNHSALM